MVFRRRSHLRERERSSRRRFTFRLMLRTKCSKRSARNSSTRSTKSISKAKNGGVSLPLPLAEGWGEGIATERQIPSFFLIEAGSNEGREFSHVLRYALTLPSPKGRRISDIKFRPTSDAKTARRVAARCSRIART